LAVSTSASGPSVKAEELGKVLGMIVIIGIVWRVVVVLVDIPWHEVGTGLFGEF